MAKKMKNEARKKMLKELSGMMHDDMHEGMGDKMKSMKKVTVMSDSKDGLKKGLSKAQEIMEKRKSDFEHGGMKKKMKGDSYEDGGMKTTEAPESLGEGDGYKRGYREEFQKKQPQYLGKKLRKKMKK